MPAVKVYRVVIQPMDWPTWALVAALFAHPGDQGLGDTLRRELGDPKGALFKRWHESIFGLWAKPCDCAAKLTRLNRQFSYQGETAVPRSGSGAAARLQASR